MKLVMELVMARTVLSLLLLYSSLSVMPAIGQNSEHKRIAVVASVDVPQLSPKQLHRLFTLERKLLPNRRPVSLLCQPLSQPVSHEFARQLFDLYPYQLQRLWDRQIFSGKAEQPGLYEDDIGVLTVVAERKNVLGYINYDEALIAEYKGRVNVLAVY